MYRAQKNDELWLNFYGKTIIDVRLEHKTLVSYKKKRSTWWISLVVKWYLHVSYSMCVYNIKPKIWPLKGTNVFMVFTHAWYIIENNIIILIPPEERLTLPPFKTRETCWMTLLPLWYWRLCIHICHQGCVLIRKHTHRHTVSPGAGEESWQICWVFWLSAGILVLEACS